MKLKLNNFHRMFLVCLVVAIKFNEDLYFPNSFYANIGGISLADLNSLEANYLNLLEYSLFVEEDLYMRYYTFLQTLIKKKAK